MAEIKQKYYWKENPDGTRSKVYFYPVTSAKAVVIDSEGNTLDEKLEELEESGGSLTAEQLAKIAEIDNKVDKVSGKGLSSNDYTNADKSKLDGIDMASKQDVISDLAAIRSGAALGASALQSHQDISNLATKSELNTLDSKCGDLSELSTSDKTSLVKAVNEANSKYSKPSGGIPKTDLASDVQTSLGKADSALQSHQTLKTINSQSILGEGNIVIEGGGGNNGWVKLTEFAAPETSQTTALVFDEADMKVYSEVLIKIKGSRTSRSGKFRVQCVDDNNAVNIYSYLTLGSYEYADIWFKKIDKYISVFYSTHNASNAIYDTYVFADASALDNIYPAFLQYDSNNIFNNSETITIFGRK